MTDDAQAIPDDATLHITAMTDRLDPAPMEWRLRTGDEPAVLLALGKEWVPASEFWSWSIESDLHGDELGHFLPSVAFSAPTTHR
jgi:hypothetical protein